jgi:hypothetical protein
MFQFLVFVAAAQNEQTMADGALLQIATMVMEPS